MRYGHVAIVVIAVTEGHASCEHEIEIGDLFILAPNGSTACLTCGIPTLCGIVRRNSASCGVPVEKIDAAELTLRRLMPPRPERWIDYDDPRDAPGAS